ncbi:Bug family tripartite tricarboxylate transporter substrate binding protein [Hydrogenophaga sp. BPS33]|uniref:Bug family tripartite tricarboxylate transporter substrate binding protein n=1 Tax=Hydrogenophaga sp. BPS33 TaxID=2651974 RepID=UPI001F3E4318|nr:tripartite tricarboxylate transporter substrate binding protein [Hydrogenophaga sp. BPS33]
MNIQTLCVRLFATLVLLTGSTFVQAQPYPSKPVRMVVPYAPGGAPDVLARALGIGLAESFGQQFVVENKPGAGGIGAAELVARAPGDGHLLFFSDIQQLAINPYLFKKLPYDAGRDFVPISLAATIPLYIAAQSSLNIHNLADLVAYAKANPGKLNYGSSGIGSIHHIAMEALLASLKIQATHVPYRGAGQSVPAFMGGETALVIAAYPQLSGHVDTGKARFVAVTTAKRAAQAPNVPAVAETVPGYDFSSEMGIVAPAGTPAVVVDRLAAAIGKALKDPATVQRLNGMGAAVVASSPAGYRENIQSNLIKFKSAIELTGLKPE